MRTGMRQEIKMQRPVEMSREQLTRRASLPRADAFPLMCVITAGIAQHINAESKHSHKVNRASRSQGCE